jgi:hypothetical protein
MATRSTITNRPSVCAARFLSSADLTITSILIDTATNSKPIKAPAAPPAITANELQGAKTILAFRDQRDGSERQISDPTRAALAFRALRDGVLHARHPWRAFDASTQAPILLCHV